MIVDSILGENFHPEIFKRCVSVFKFLFENGYGIKLLEKLWNAIDYDEKSVFEMIIELSKSFTPDLNEFIA